MSHRYKTGQVLELRSANRQSNRPAGTCEVVACLPHDRGPLLYRIKSWNEAIERVVEEDDLSPSGTVKTVFQTTPAPLTIAVRKKR